MKYIHLTPKPLFEKVILRENNRIAEVDLGEPYTKKKVGGKWKVYKADAKGKATGKALGTHDTEKGADEQLKALYASEVKQDITNFTEEVQLLAEAYFEDLYEPTYGATSFADLMSYEEAVERTQLLRKRTIQLMSMLMDALYFEDDPIAIFKTLFNEYLGIASNALNQDMEEAAQTIGEIQERSNAHIKVKELNLDNGKGVDIPTTLTEAEIATIQGSLDTFSMVNERRRPLFVDIAVIEPGWGNEADNHYYSSEMLKEFGYVFGGAKMYETDHKPDEKSTRTWVSTTIGLQGFTDTGAPVQRVYVHDPDFSEKLRNLNDEKMLSLMECSIYATGTVENDEFQDVDGRVGRRVVSLDEGAGIDWVTAAGAGGRALNLIESTKGGKPMPPTEQDELEDEVVETTESANPTIRVSIRESDSEDELPEDDAVLEDEDLEDEDDTEEDDTDTGDEPEALEMEEIQAIVNETNLPKPTKARLIKGTYGSLAELKAAVDEAVAEVKAITGSGSVFGMNSQFLLEADYRPASVEEITEAEAEFKRKYNLSS